MDAGSKTTLWNQRSGPQSVEIRRNGLQTEQKS